MLAFTNSYLIRSCYQHYLRAYCPKTGHEDNKYRDNPYYRPVCPPINETGRGWGLLLNRNTQLITISYECLFSFPATSIMVVLAPSASEAICSMEIWENDTLRKDAKNSSTRLPPLWREFIATLFQKLYGNFQLENVIFQYVIKHLQMIITL